MSTQSPCAYQAGPTRLLLDPTRQQLLAALAAGVVVQDAVVVLGAVGLVVEGVSDAPASVPAQPLTLVVVAQPVGAQLVAGLERVQLAICSWGEQQEEEGEEEPSTEDPSEESRRVCGPRRYHAGRGRL